MMQIRRSASRGNASFGWLQSKHSFSFANYYGPAHMGVSVLRVLNDDRVAPGYGFETHPHRDMEIISYVLAGEIEHRDTMGSHSRLKAGEVQVMSAGTGILHSEFNASSTVPLHFLQIWITPQQKGLTPSYQQRPFPNMHGLTLLASPDAEQNSLPINQDARLYRLQLEATQTTLQIEADRIGYLHLIDGELTIQGETLYPGDAVTLTDIAEITLNTTTAAHGLLFDLPAEEN